MSACVETTVCNPEWLKACNRMSKVIVPSEFVKGMLEATSSQFSVPITTPVFVVPESYYDDLTGLGESILDLKPTDFAILLNGQITGMNSQLDRKNMFNTIRWLCETFRDDPNVVIVIKTNMARNTIIDRFVSKNLMTRLLSEVRPRSNPRVMLVHGDLRDVEMTGLYKHPNVKALVSLTRGEGFGLPLLEAAVAGLPVVATDWSAHKEFLDDRFTKIQSTLVDVPKQKIDGNIFIGGAKWAEPSELDFKKKIVQLRKDQTIALGMSKSLSQDLSNSHSQVSIESQYESIFKEVLCWWELLSFSYS
jgi:glycosyltransferase involved in cell wall biosynthesis